MFPSRLGLCRCPTAHRDALQPQRHEHASHTGLPFAVSIWHEGPGT